MTDRNQLAAKLLEGCPAESLDDHKAIAAALLRGDSNEQVLAMNQLDAWPETYVWLKGELSGIKRYDIAGKAVTAEFDIEDFRHEDPAAFGAVDVNAILAINGKHFEICMQANESGVLALAGSEAGYFERNVDLICVLAPGVDLDDDRAWQASLETLVAPLIEGAQEKYDSYMCILNDVDEPVEGVELDCGCALNGTSFRCSGDGYIIISDAPGFQQLPDRCYEIDEVTAAALREIEENTCADGERTSQVIDLVSEIPLVRAPAQAQGMSR